MQKKTAVRLKRIAQAVWQKENKKRARQLLRLAQENPDIEFEKYDEALSSGVRDNLAVILRCARGLQEMTQDFLLDEPAAMQLEAARKNIEALHNRLAESESFYNSSPTGY